MRDSVHDYSEHPTRAQNEILLDVGKQFERIADALEDDGND